MKTNLTIKLLLLTFALSLTTHAKTSFTEKDILGVWKLTKFVITDEDGSEQEWCGESYGSIAYLPGLMAVSINCGSVESGSGAEKIGGYLFYSGPFEVDRKTSEVIHRVRNYSHPSLNKVYRRTIEMKDDDHLRLVGFLGAGKKAIVEWVRAESFDYNSKDLYGVWELVGSENEVIGSDQKIPFCTGFNGTILYTPKGYTAVSINCGKKKNPNISEPADQFGRKYFYASKYFVNSDVLTQVPDNASVVEQIGKAGSRKMSIEGDLLVLEGTNGSKFKAKWKKVRSFVGL